MTALPTKITPNPLLSSAIELRFVKGFTEEFIDRTLIPKITSTHQLEPANISFNEPNNPFRINLRNDKFLVSIGKKNLLFENLNEYQLWGNYLPFIKSILNTLSDLYESLILERIGIRYISFFSKDSTGDVRVLKKPFMMLEDELGDIINKNFYGNFSFNKGQLSYLIQIGNSVRFPGENDLVEGVVIDIDVSVSANLPSRVDDDFYQLIEILHNAEKLTFMEILNEEFVKTLNISYEDGNM